MASNTAHTPGPWHVGSPIPVGCSARVFSSAGYAIATVERDVLPNARLIAAAPELLSICRVVLHQAHARGGVSQATVEQVRAVLKKASGQ